MTILLHFDELSQKSFYNGFQLEKLIKPCIKKTRRLVNYPTKTYRNRLKLTTENSIYKKEPFGSLNSRGHLKQSKIILRTTMS